MVSCDVGLADQVALATSDQQHIAAGFIDRGARGAHALDGGIQAVERLLAVAGRILDRKPRNAGLRAQPYVLPDPRRIGRVAGLEVGVHREVGRLHDLADMGEHEVARHAAVRQRPRERKARAGGRQRLETEKLQIARAADVPRIGDHEAARFVQVAEGAALVGDRRHGAAADCIRESPVPTLDQPGGCANTSDGTKGTSNLRSSVAKI